MTITVGIEPTICAPKTAQLPTAIIVIIILSMTKVNIIFQFSKNTNKKSLNIKYGGVSTPPSPFLPSLIRPLSLIPCSCKK